MRRVLRFLLLKPVLWAAGKFSSKPNRQKIFDALSALYTHILDTPDKEGPVIPFEQHSGKFIIFSDQHKGRRNGADDFIMAEPNYLAALDYYHKEGFCFINLGDSEELWENTLWQVRNKNKATFEAEKKFVLDKKYVKVSGNHDLYWNTSPLAPLDLYAMYGSAIKIYDGVVLKTIIKKPGVVDLTNNDNGNIITPFSTDQHTELSIFLTHGHQGDAQSDGNWFSKFFVGWIWAPLQALLRVNPNTPAYNNEKKTLHNSIMYEWSSAQKDLLLITGHTHQPVFASLTHIERLYKDFQFAEKEKNEKELTVLLDEIRKREKEFTAVSLDYMTMRPTYFNTGCCCFDDGDITGVEIADGGIRLIKWCLKDGKPWRQVLEEREFGDLVK